MQLDMRLLQRPKTADIRVLKIREERSDGTKIWLSYINLSIIGTTRK